MKLPMILLWKAVVLEVGVQGVKAHPKNFDLLKIWAKSLKIRVYTQRCLTSKHDTQSLQKNTWRPFFGGHTQKGVHDLCGKKILGKIAQKTFRASLGKFGQNSFALQKFACSYTYDEKALPPPLPPFERAVGEMLLPCLHPPASLCILFYTLYTRCGRLQCVTEMNI